MKTALLLQKKKRKTREHWIQCITFAAETNAACSRGSAESHTQRDSATDGRQATQYLLRSLSGGESNNSTYEKNSYMIFFHDTNCRKKRTPYSSDYKHARSSVIL